MKRYVPKYICIDQTIWSHTPRSRCETLFQTYRVVEGHFSIYRFHLPLHSSPCHLTFSQIIDCQLIYPFEHKFHTLMPSHNAPS